ncbi:arginine deiminase family protein [Sphaerisporangium sp. TRM90804]|uniref:dimethylarginine dimethylaminohydrolase family protein n=1 Tax=Sphaerisporangium sp. TRM90804 TaxID=3031113 RepID=UPI002449A51B|nr:arginine deiminase family protein [Sphaerisporangium sp. TRM90804]MDH2424616.1 arginine deiminase family protein [Sphaerisporangium sp. TRM90804]
MRVHVDAEWDRLTVAALARPTNFEPVEPVNATQRMFFATADAPRREKMLVQHDAVRAALVREGVEVVDIAPLEGAPLQFNVRDPAAVVGEELVLGRMGAAVRAGEPGHVGRSVAAPAAPVTAGVVEGGDVMVTPDVVFVGLGERTDEAGYAGLCFTRKVVAIPLAPGVLHLDVAMNLIGPGLGVIHPPAVESLPPELAGVTWVEVTEEEYREQGANVLALGPGRVMMDARHTRLRRELTAHGVTCLPLDLDEITKIGGGVRCMVLPLRRAPAGPAGRR